MNEQNYTSPKLSKLLAENGCKLESKYSHFTHFDTKKTEFILDSKLMSKEKRKFEETEWYPAYDILNDLCVKYRKNLFSNKVWDKKFCKHPPSHYVPIGVLRLLMVNKIQEAEDYFWEHCKLNPKNI